MYNQKKMKNIFICHQFLFSQHNLSTITILTQKRRFSQQQHSCIFIYLINAQKFQTQRTCHTTSSHHFSHADHIIYKAIADISDGLQCVTLNITPYLYTCPVLRHYVKPWQHPEKQNTLYVTYCIVVSRGQNHRPRQCANKIWWSLDSFWNTQATLMHPYLLRVK